MTDILRFSSEDNTIRNFDLEVIQAENSEDKSFYSIIEKKMEQKNHSQLMENMTLLLI